MTSAGVGGGGVSPAPYTPPYFGNDGLFRDCSSGACSIYCPQWCTYIFPPPPPEDSAARFPPLFIALIGVLAVAFLLVCYYAVVSKYCRGRRQRRRVRQEFGPDPDGGGDQPRPARPAAAPAGLDEAVLKSITVHKYRSKGDGSVKATDCSVCLCRFKEGDNLRLLPRCTHAFHVHCIDKWFRDHSNCPICRSDVAAAPPAAVANPPAAAAPPPPAAPGSRNSPELQIERGGDAADLQRGGLRTDDETLDIVVVANADADPNAAPRKRSAEGGNEATRPKERVRDLPAISAPAKDSLSVAAEVVIRGGEDHQIRGSSVMGAGSSRKLDKDEKAKRRSIRSEGQETKASEEANRSVPDQHSKGKNSVGSIPN